MRDQTSIDKHQLTPGRLNRRFPPRHPEWKKDYAASVHAYLVLRFRAEDVSKRHSRVLDPMLAALAGRLNHPPVG